MISCRRGVYRASGAASAAQSRFYRHGSLCLSRNVVVTRPPGGKRFIEMGLEALQAKGTTKLGVTSYITQYDELNQIKEYSEGQPKKSSVEMYLGNQVHGALEDRIGTAPPLPGIDLQEEIEGLSETASRDVTQIVKFVDNLVALGFNDGPSPGVVREFPMRGIAPGTGCILRGVIDCAYISKQGIVIMETKSTSMKPSPTLMRLAYHQALTYHWMLKTLLETDQLMPLLKAIFIAPETPHSVEEFLDQHASKMQEAVARLRTIGLAPYVNIQVFNRRALDYLEEVYEVPYDEQVLMEQLRSRADLLTGGRQPYTFSLRELEHDEENPMVVVTDAELGDDLTESEKKALNL